MEDDKSHRCFVQTWDDHSLMSICVWVEPLGRAIPSAELSGLSQIVDSKTSCQLPLSCQGGCPTLVRVLSESRIDNRDFIVFREFNVDVFLHCLRLAYQETFGGLEVSTMVDFLVLRLRGALQESWLEGVTALRRCVTAGRVSFDDLCDVVITVVIHLSNNDRQPFVHVLGFVLFKFRCTISTDSTSAPIKRSTSMSSVCS